MILTGINISAVENGLRRDPEFIQLPPEVQALLLKFIKKLPEVLKKVAGKEICYKTFIETLILTIGHAARSGYIQDYCIAAGFKKNEQPSLVRDFNSREIELKSMLESNLRRLDLQEITEYWLIFEDEIPDQIILKFYRQKGATLADLFEASPMTFMPLVSNEPIALEELCS